MGVDVQGVLCYINNNTLNSVPVMAGPPVISKISYML